MGEGHHESAGPDRSCFYLFKPAKKVCTFYIIKRQNVDLSWISCDETRAALYIAMILLLRYQHAQYTYGKTALTVWYHALCMSISHFPNIPSSKLLYGSKQVFLERSTGSLVKG